MGLFGFLKKLSANNANTIAPKCSAADISPSQYQKMREDEEKWLEKHFDFNSVDELDIAVANGCTEIWELAEHFGVTEQIMRKAVCYYVHGNLATELYF